MLDHDQAQAFEAALKENPLDQTTRLVYADWLEERGRDDEARRQRKWVAAYHVLAVYADPYTEIEDEETGRMTGKHRPRDYRQVMQEVNDWADQVRLSGNVCFRTNYCQDKLAQEDSKAEFWDALEAVTGVAPSERLRHRDYYDCAC